MGIEYVSAHTTSPSAAILQAAREGLPLLPGAEYLGQDNFGAYEFRLPGGVARHTWPEDFAVSINDEGCFVVFYGGQATDQRAVIAALEQLLHEKGVDAHFVEE